MQNVIRELFAWTDLCEGTLIYTGVVFLLGIISELDQITSIRSICYQNLSRFRMYSIGAFYDILTGPLMSPLSNFRFPWKFERANSIHSGSITLAINNKRPKVHEAGAWVLQGRLLKPTDSCPYCRIEFATTISGYQFTLGSQNTPLKGKTSNKMSNCHSHRYL